VEEKLKFTLEATFTTRVPLPVVTVDPMVVSIDELELGELTSWTYTVTNHGLIRATGFSLTLPGSRLSWGSLGMTLAQQHR